MDIVCVRSLLADGMMVLNSSCRIPVMEKRGTLDATERKSNGKSERAGYRD